jgi:hypothetical protein
MLNSTLSILKKEAGGFIKTGQGWESKTNYFDTKNGMRDIINLD